MVLTTLLAAGPAPADTPEPELLEFLGGFETSGGKWLDPLILDEKTSELPPPREEEQP
jgi:hypothetical protein